MATTAPDRAPDEAASARSRVVDYVHGPIISSSDLDAHLALFAAFGLREAGRVQRSEADVRAIWGIDGQSSEEVALETPGSRFGLRLVRFSPGSDTVIRSEARGSDSEALKVIDFYAPDLPAARRAIEDAGFVFRDAVAEYDTPEGRFTEAHLWGPDGVVCALVSGDPEFFERFATIRDRLVSEPQSISGPVRDPKATIEFFRRVFGLEPIHTYGVADDSFQALVGAGSTLNVRAWNVGTDTREPYFGVIDYGLPADRQVSLAAVSRPPARGLIGATLVVRDIGAVADAARSFGGTEPAEAVIPGIGPAHIVTVPAPNGGWYQALQPIKSRTA
jgi:catechol 2,3-dioxygenase-like lactoylglutathione lyase family enzyme